MFYEKNLKSVFPPANTRRRTNVGLMADQRRRRCPNIKPSLVQHLVFLGLIWLNVNLTDHGFCRFQYVLLVDKITVIVNEMLG